MFLLKFLNKPMQRGNDFRGGNIFFGNPIASSPSRESTGVSLITERQQDVIFYFTFFDLYFV